MLIKLMCESITLMKYEKHAWISDRCALGLLGLFGVTENYTFVYWAFKLRLHTFKLYMYTIYTFALCDRCGARICNVSNSYSIINICRKIILADFITFHQSCTIHGHGSQTCSNNCKLLLWLAFR